MPENTSVTVQIYERQQLVYKTELTSILEFGRQSSEESFPYIRIEDRIIIAKINEREISRKHVLLTLLPDQKIRIENISKVNAIRIGADEILQPGKQSEVTGSVLLVLFDRAWPAKTGEIKTGKV